MLILHGEVHVLTKLNAIRYQQKHATRVIFDKNILSHSSPLLRSLNALNVNQINLYQYINFTYKSKNKYTPRIFNDIIKKPIQQYQTQFSKDNFRVKKFSLRSTKYSVSIRGSKIWNEFFTHEEKSLESHRCFLKKSNLH